MPYSDDALRPLRILHLSDILFEEKPGGSRQVARELLREQIKAGHDATLLVSRSAPGAPQQFRDAEYGNVVQYDKGGDPTAWVRNGREACEKLLREAARENKPFDVVHTHFAYAALGPLQAIKNSMPHVRTFHGPWDTEGFVEDTANARKNPIVLAKALLKRRMRFGIEQANLRSAAAILTLSGVFQNELRRFGIDPEKATIIPGGVNRDRFNVEVDDSEARIKARARVGLPEATFPLLLSIRRLVPRMGLENLLTSFPRVREVFPFARLVIGGRGPLDEALRTLATSLGIADAVTFAGFIPDDQVTDYYRGADVFVLPTLSLEGFGLVTVESLACGTPVIATPVGAIPEVLGSLEERLLTNGTDARALSDAVLRYFQAKKSGEAWATNLSAKRLSGYVDDRYTWAKHAHAVEAVYRRILK
ncbi:MAG: glycosyltransferase family 4 protein [Akkermansiaceae bacterium]|nr:glycosyltransferase family 4 protein [Armatimonadota bacterium]